MWAAGLYEGGQIQKHAVLFKLLLQGLSASKATSSSSHASVQELLLELAL